MNFSPQATGKIAYQFVHTKLEAYDKNGKKIGLFESEINDGLRIGSDPPRFVDIQDYIPGNELQKWINAGLCSLKFTRSGDFKIAQNGGVEIRFEHQGFQAYNPPTDPQRMIMFRYRIDNGSWNYRTTIRDVKFMGPSLYNATWEEKVDTTITAGTRLFGIGTSDKYSIKGSVTWNFPEKAALNGPVPFIDVNAEVIRKSP
jgi:hypothetical protein